MDKTLNKKISLFISSIFLMFYIQVIADELYFYGGNAEHCTLRKVTDKIIEYSTEEGIKIADRKEAYKIVYENGKTFYFDDENQIESDKIYKQSIPVQKKKTDNIKSDPDNNNDYFSITIFPFTTVFGTIGGTLYNRESVMFVFSAEAELNLFWNLSLAFDCRAAGITSSYELDEGEKDTETYSIYGPGLRYYTEGNGMRDFFLGLYVEKYTHTDEEIRKEYTRTTMKKRGPVVSLWMGYRFIDSGNLFVEISTGISYYYLHKKTNDYDMTPYPIKNESVEKGLMYSGIGFGVGLLF